MGEISLVYTTVSSEKDAKKLAEKIVKTKVCACVNMHPISSMYWWKGRIAKEKEYALLFKTTKKNEKKLIEMIKDNHTYEIPCIICVPAEASKEFFSWIKDPVENGA